MHQPAIYRRYNHYRWLFVALLSFLLSACFGSSRSIGPDYYLLTSDEVQTAAITTAANFSIGVGPVRVAPFLMRPQIVTHGGSGTMNIQSGQRWGEPLEQGIQRVLRQNLSTLTGAQTRNFPWRQNTAPDYALRIDVSDLDRLDGNTALLEVSWVLEDLQNRTVVTTQQTRLTTSISGNDAAALANAYSELLEQLAQQVQQQLLKSQQQSPARLSQPPKP
jgi:uncharacterized lipoprotein YmbA